MITLSDFYHVMTAMVPLYAAMVVAYGSVKWWKIFTPEQCSGINRFVALFAVPLLSFHFISSNNPYQMNLRFLAADTLQKLIVLAALAVWCRFTARGSLDWSITLFSLSTLPNTLVMGIPLLKGMYGHDSGSLMVQIVVLQCIIWYTLMLFLFEFRGARLLIGEQFPDTAGEIAAIHVDADVMSLDGRMLLETDAEVKDDGKLHITVRRSNAARSDVFARPSNLTNAEIYSLQSSRNQTPRGSSFNHGDFARSSNFGAGDVFGFSGPTPRQSNFDGANYPAPNPGMFSPTNVAAGKKDGHMFAWSSGASPMRVALSPNKGEDQRERQEEYNLERDGFSFGNRETSHSQLENGETKVGDGRPKSTPPTSVMTRLILIMVWRKLIRNPNTYSSLIGLTWSLVSFRWKIEMPILIAKSISILSDAGLGMAMFSLGLFMALQPKMIACGNSVATYAMAVRFVTGPAVMAAASIAVGLKGALLHIAIVQAALPQGIVPFVFAKEYNVHPNILSTAVIFGMLIALPITLVYYILLGL